MEDKTGALLFEMYKNTRMGSAGIVSILPKVNDKFMIRELAEGLERCEGYAKSVGDMIHGRGEEPCELPASSRLRMKAGIAFNTAVDSSDRNIAGIYVTGAKSAVRKLERARLDAEDCCDAQVLSLCTDIIEKEKMSISKMEAFL